MYDNEQRARDSRQVVGTMQDICDPV